MADTNDIESTSTYSRLICSIQFGALQMHLNAPVASLPGSLRWLTLEGLGTRLYSALGLLIYLGTCIISKPREAWRWQQPGAAVMPVPCSVMQMWGISLISKHSAYLCLDVGGCCFLLELKSGGERGGEVNICMWRGAVLPQHTTSRVGQSPSSNII